MNYINTLLLSMMEGLAVTLEIFFLTLVFSMAVGILVAIGRVSKIKILTAIIQFYIWLMRGTPLLLQLIFVFFGLPIVGITLTRFNAALLTFILNYGAYFGEIFRGGMQSIDKGQYEAAEVLGLGRGKTFLRIILPQMIKTTFPSITNEVITLVKDTSLVYVVGLGELLRVGKIASNRDASLVPLVVVAIFYLLITGVLTQVFKAFENSVSYYE